MSGGLLGPEIVHIARTPNASRWQDIDTELSPCSTTGLPIRRTGPPASFPEVFPYAKMRHPHPYALNRERLDCRSQ